MNILVTSDKRVSFESCHLNSSMYTYYLGSFVGLIKKGEFHPNYNVVLGEDTVQEIIVAARKFLLIKDGK